MSHEQETQRGHAIRATQIAYSLTVAETASTMAAYVVSDDGLLEAPDHDFGLEL